MDKYEYKLRLEEIKTLNRKGRFQEAAQVADTIDWTKVQNISTLGIISDVYKINRRFDDSKDILLLANEKSPHNRRVIYALCDLTVKMGQVVEAVEYYKEFVQLAPNDNSKYILLYKIYEAQDISLEERIAVLKEYKKREYNEKWAYELAFLYHRVGLATECVEECDQLILWFGEGKYVAKAMELKMLYVPLSPAQQQAYDRHFGRKPERQEEKPAKVKEQKLSEQSQNVEKQEEELDIQVKPMDMGKYNTINLQAALAESMKEVLDPVQTEQSADEEPVPQPAVQPAAGVQQMQPAHRPAYGGDDAEYQEDVSKVMQASANWDAQATGQLETGGLQSAAARDAGAGEADGRLDNRSRKIQQGPWASGQAEPAFTPSAQGRTGQPQEMETLLAQEYDGQISLALPEERAIEKQITGQMNIEDVLAEWERLKRENEEKRKRETRQWMLQQTGSLFQDFDQISRDGVLEKLQREEALPAETVQRDRIEDPSAMTEVEELEELEDMDDLPKWEGTPTPAPQSQPTPANAAARVVMAAQGMLEEGPKQPYAQPSPVPQPAPMQTQPEPQPSPVPQPAPMQAQPEPQPYAQPSPVPQPAPMQTQPYAQPSPVPQPAPMQAQPEQQPYAQPSPAPQPAPMQAQPEPQPAGREEESEEGGSARDLHAKISEQQLEEHVRSMTKEEKALFAPFVPTRGAMRQLVKALDRISLSAFTGNMVITGAPGSDMMKLAKNVIREVRASDQNFSGKIAKISGDVLNARSAEAMLAKIPNGALIVEKAGKLSDEGTENLTKALNQEHTGIIVFLLDEKRAIGRVLDRSPQLAACFTARFDIAALDSGTLVKYGCQYAYNMEYSIDELGRLALHTRIEDMQTTTHAVTIEEVRDIVDEAIEHANKKTLGHFMDILFRKRYDEDDMIVLGEKDFI